MKMLLRIPTEVGPRTAVIFVNDVCMAHSLADAVMGAGGDATICDDTKGYSFLAAFKKRRVAKEKAARKSGNDAEVIPLRKKERS